MRKKLLVLPRPDGFCNQMQTVQQALALCLNHGLDFVAPEMYEFVQYDRERSDVSYEFSDYFDGAGFCTGGAWNQFRSASICPGATGFPMCGSARTRQRKTPGAPGWIASTS